MFCHCGDAENLFYQDYMSAENHCINEAIGGGYGSCLAVELGYVSKTKNHRFKPVACDTTGDQLYLQTA